MRIAPRTLATRDGAAFIVRSAKPNEAGALFDHYLTIRAREPEVNVEEADEWLETSNEVGLNGVYDAGPYGTFTARVSGVFSLTGGGVDAAVSNGDEINDHEYTLESGYLKWQSGDLFRSLGFNALEISGGNQNYQVFDGLLFWDGGQDGGDDHGHRTVPFGIFRFSGSS